MRRTLATPYGSGCSRVAFDLVSSDADELDDQVFGHRSLLGELECAFGALRGLNGPGRGIDAHVVLVGGEIDEVLAAVLERRDAVADRLFSLWHETLDDRLHALELFALSRRKRADVLVHLAHPRSVRATSGPSKGIKTKRSGGGGAMVLVATSLRQKGLRRIGERVGHEDRRRCNRGTTRSW